MVPSRDRKRFAPERTEPVRFGTEPIDRFQFVKKRTVEPIKIFERGANRCGSVRNQSEPTNHLTDQKIFLYIYLPLNCNF